MKVPSFAPPKHLSLGHIPLNQPSQSILSLVLASRSHAILSKPRFCAQDELCLVLQEDWLAGNLAAIQPIPPHLERQSGGAAAGNQS